MALTTSRKLRHEILAGADLTLKSGEVAYKGGIAVLELATGKVLVGAVGAGLLFLGHFSRDVDASAADTSCHVRFETEVRATWYKNDVTDVVTVVGDLCYIFDDETVSSNAVGTSVAGRVWDLDATRGVLVQPALV